MQKLLIILLMLPLFSMGQMAKEYVPDNLYNVELHLKKPTKTSNNTPQIHPGVALMLGGGMFTLLGLTTPREGEIVDGHYQNKPFYRQGASFIATISGGVLLLTGIVITIGN